MEPRAVRGVIIRSTRHDDRLSLRLEEDDATATKFICALTEAGFEPGDRFEIRKVGEESWKPQRTGGRPWQARLVGEEDEEKEASDKA